MTPEQRRDDLSSRLLTASRGSFDQFMREACAQEKVLSVAKCTALGALAVVTAGLGMEIHEHIAQIAEGGMQGWIDHVAMGAQTIEASTGTSMAGQTHGAARLVAMVQTGLQGGFETGGQNQIMQGLAAASAAGAVALLSGTLGKGFEALQGWLNDRGQNEPHAQATYVRRLEDKASQLEPGAETGGPKL